MLSPNEFMIGNVGNAKPLSLVLPTNKHEVAMLVGQRNEVSVAVVLSGEHTSLSFESEGNEHWSGLIIPNVRIEIDETSFVDTYSSDKPPLSVVRTATKLVIATKSKNSFERPSKMVTLHDNLMSAGKEFQAAFTKWQVVLGDGETKRVLWRLDMSA